MWKKLLCVGAVLLLVALSPYIVLFAAFSDIGYSEVVDTVYSPDGSYRAELIDSNDGALGGDTVVKVYDETGILPRRPQTVYIGPWGEFEDMELYWKSDTVLCINGKAYEIEED